MPSSEHRVVTRAIFHYEYYTGFVMSLSTFHSNPLPVASAEIFAISVLVGGNDCDKQPSYEYCGEGNKWFHHYSTLELPYDIGGYWLVSWFLG